MCKWWFCGGFLCAVFSLSCLAEGNSGIAFVDVNVVPMDGERVLEHQTVLIKDDLIATLKSGTAI